MKQSKSCMNCKHFVRHYIICQEIIVPLDFGHCMYPRLKDRKISDVCDYFEQTKQIDTLRFPLGIGNKSQGR